jgi:hypothetical protein
MLYTCEICWELFKISAYSKIEIELEGLIFAFVNHQIQVNLRIQTELNQICR